MSLENYSNILGNSETDYFIQDSIDNERLSTINKINELYNNVIEKFRKGELDVYNPDIFCRLTRNNFIDWIINHNPHVAEIFEN